MIDQYRTVREALPKLTLRELEDFVYQDRAILNIPLSRSLCVGHYRTYLEGVVEIQEAEINRRRDAAEVQVIQCGRCDCVGEVYYELFGIQGCPVCRGAGFLEVDACSLLTK